MIVKMIGAAAFEVQRKHACVGLYILHIRALISEHFVITQSV